MLDISYNIIFFIIGTVFFSFLNVVIYRVPNHISFVKGRSFCPSCGNQLKSYDMIPILSWIFLGGKCRNCKKKISIRYPLVEALGGVCAVLCLEFFGTWNGYWHTISFPAVVVFVVLALFTVITFIDHDTMEIPNGVILALLVPAIGATFAFQEILWWERLIGVFCVSVPMLLLTLIVPGAFGGGDMKLMAVAGWILGWKMTLVSFFIAILLGGFYGIYLLATKKKEKKDHFAFGPFLCVGMAITFFWGEAILAWYLRFFL